ncbi:MAG: response regulator transcription factor [Acidiferrobacterales bacterium]|nr:response regulator transcription factor [Acidiferrobacterales bacterium]
MINVLLVDDHSVVRAGYKALLQSAEDIQVVAEAETGERGCQLYASLQPDVVVMDLSLPGIGGLKAIRHMIARDSNAKIIVFSMHDDISIVEKALDAGSKGYITKNSVPDIMVDAVREIAKGHSYIEPALKEKLALRGASGQDDNLSGLTPREFEIFLLLAQGHSAQEAANRLALSYKTVANYTTQIKTKLKLSTVTEIVHLALRHGMVKTVDTEEV